LAGTDRSCAQGGGSIKEFNVARPDAVHRCGKLHRLTDYSGISERDKVYGLRESPACPTDKTK
jgi:hypothetical protein